MSGPRPNNGRKAGSVMRAVCKRCGSVQTDSYASNNYLCPPCSDERVASIRAMADEGLNQTEIARRLGIGQATVSIWCIRNNILTASQRKRVEGVREKREKIDPFRRPVKPTEFALKAVSVFNLGAS